MVSDKGWRPELEELPESAAATTATTLLPTGSLCRPAMVSTWMPGAIHQLICNMRLLQHTQPSFCSCLWGPSDCHMQG